MKKIIMHVICLGLLLGSSASAIISPKRFAQCMWNPKKYNCTSAEEQQTKIGIATASIGAIIALLALIGITVDADRAKAIKEARTEPKGPNLQNPVTFYFAIVTNNTDLIQQILDAGVPIDRPLANDLTPLSTAAEQGKPAVVQLLLEKGAYPRLDETLRGKVDRAIVDMITAKAREKFSVAR